MRPCSIPRARCERYVAAGMTLRQLAAAEGWCVWAVQRHVAALGIRLPSRAVVTPADIHSVIAGRETARQAAARLCDTRAAVYLAGVRAGIRIGAARQPAQLDLFQHAA